VRAQAGQAVALAPERVLRLLSTGEIEVEGLIPWSSNATLLVTIRDDELSTLAIYKPQRGERPLWDFPSGTLGMREVAAYLVSEALGWGFIPPTILRQGPYGLGSVQFYIPAQEDDHFFTIQHDPAYTEELMRQTRDPELREFLSQFSGDRVLDLEEMTGAIRNKKGTTWADRVFLTLMAFREEAR